MCVAEGRKPFSKGAYALGKIVWGKGWEELLLLLDQGREERSEVLAVPLDCFGAGEAASEVRVLVSVSFSCTARAASVVRGSR